MLSFGVIGASVRGGNLRLLEALVVPESERRERLAQLKEFAGFSELVPLYTCNRSEFYYTVDGRPAGVEFRNRLLDFFFRADGRVAFEPSDVYSLGAFRALRHLYRVSASLDSMMVGEAQILGQVKEALANAQTAGLAGPNLGTVFAEAFRVAKKVRRETPLGQNSVSMINLLLETINSHLSQVPNPTLAIVGVGPMSVKLAKSLTQSGGTRLVFVNRTVAKAEELAAQFGGAAVALDDFLAAPTTVDALFTATGSDRPIFTSDVVDRLQTARRGRPDDLLIIDLALPRDVDATVDEMPGVRCLDIAHFRSTADRHRRERFRAVDAAEKIIDAAIARAHMRNAHTQFQPVMASSLNEALAHAQAEMQRLFATRLAHLSPDDRDSIARWVRQLVQYTNHLPMNALAAQADYTNDQCALLAGYGCVEERDSDSESDHPAAHRCAAREVGVCVGRHDVDLDAL